MNSKMHGWRKVAAYMTDREKKLMAESFFGNAYEGEISRRSSTGEPMGRSGSAMYGSMLPVACDVAHVTCESVRLGEIVWLIFQMPLIRTGKRVVPRSNFVPESNK